MLACQPLLVRLFQNGTTAHCDDPRAVAHPIPPVGHTIALREHGRASSDKLVTMITVWLAENDDAHA